MPKDKNIASLFSTCYVSVTKFLTLKYGVGDEADDIAQEAFHNILRVPDSTTIDDPKAYLFRAASNIALNHIRRQGYQQDYITSLMHTCDINPHNDMDATPFMEKYENMLAGWEGSIQIQLPNEINIC